MATFNPYSFDPQHNSSSSSENDSDDSCITIFNDTQDVLEEQAVENNLWCSCLNCGKPAAKAEQKCCHNEELIVRKMEEHEAGCITDNPDFNAAFLNMTVLEIAFLQYCEDNGYRPNPRDIHRKYRYVAYRLFARWIWQRLGKSTRLILPSCVVKKIRERFPSEVYTGFKYPRLLRM